MRDLNLVLARLAANAARELYSKLENGVISPIRVASIAFILTAMSLAANAATFTVTNTNDSGAGSLRQAVLDANSAAGADTIDFSFTSAQTIVLTSGELVFPGTITINGSPLFPITISGNNNSRIFNGSNANSTLTLNYLNLTAGRISGGNGGAISIFGPLVLNNCAVYGNSATSGTGGAIYHGDPLVLSRTTISGNTASGSGGGLEGDFPSSSANISDSTIAFNHSGTVGGGVHNAQSSYTVRNTIIAKNTATTGRPDFSLTMNSQGYNIVGDTSGANIVGSILGNQVNVDPLLVALSLNNGPTMTHGLQLASVAIDAGDPNRVQFPDQRGSVRGADGDANGSRGGDVGAYEKQRSKFDFVGDERSDVSVVRISGVQVREPVPEGLSGIDWYLQTSPTTYGRTFFGAANDIHVPADYDGDGKTDIAVYRPSNGTWYILGSQAGVYGLRWGNETDVPVPADYDGDGKADVAVYRAGVWYILKTQLGFTGTVALGGAADTPAPADYDGDGKADVGVFTGSTWSIINSGSGLTNTQFGSAGDTPVSADYDGDGRADIAVFRPSNGTWYILGSQAGAYGYTWGVATDVPVPADYDDDGKTDIAIFRNGVWYIQASRNGLMFTYFGRTTDIPIPGVGQ